MLVENTLENKLVGWGGLETEEAHRSRVKTAQNVESREACTCGGMTPFSTRLIVSICSPSLVESATAMPAKNSDKTSQKETRAHH